MSPRPNAVTETFTYYLVRPLKLDLLQGCSLTVTTHILVQQQAPVQTRSDQFSLETDMHIMLVLWLLKVGGGNFWLGPNNHYQIGSRSPMGMGNFEEASADQLENGKYTDFLLCSTHNSFINICLTAATKAIIPTVQPPTLGFSH